MGESNLSPPVRPYSAATQRIAINTNTYYCLLHTVLRMLFMCHHRVPTTIRSKRYSHAHFGMRLSKEVIAQNR